MNEGGETKRRSLFRISFWVKHSWESVLLYAKIENTFLKELFRLLILGKNLILISVYLLGVRRVHEVVFRK